MGRGGAQSTPGKDLWTGIGSHAHGGLAIRRRRKIFSSVLRTRIRPEKSFGPGESLWIGRRGSKSGEKALSLHRLAPASSPQGKCCKVLTGLGAADTVRRGVRTDLGIGGRSTLRALPELLVNNRGRSGARRRTSWRPATARASRMEKPSITISSSAPAVRPSRFRTSAGMTTRPALSRGPSRRRGAAVRSRCAFCGKPMQAAAVKGGRWAE